MLTLHAAPLVLPAGAAAVPDGAVAVDGDRIAALGPYPRLAAAYPKARTRHWPGLITPGLRQWHAVRLLTRAYHPDPREAAELGDQPISGPRLAGLGMTDARWGASARRGLQRMLRYGTTAVAAGTYHSPAVRAAVDRSGMAVVAEAAAAGCPVPGSAAEVSPSPPASLDPLAFAGALADAVPGPLSVGARADLAVFDVPDEAALMAAGATSCVATVLAGRLVYRRA